MNRSEVRHPSRPPTAGEPDTTTLDAAALARLKELDPQGKGELVARILRTYARSLERLMAEFIEARAAGQADRLRRVAHTLKSSSASVGAVALAALCLRVELTLRTPQAENIDTLLADLQAESVRVAHAVQAMLGS